MTKSMAKHCRPTQGIARKSQRTLTVSHKTSERQLKYNNQVSLPHQDDFKAKKDTKYCIIKQGLNMQSPQTMGATFNNDSATTTTTTEPTP